VTCARAALLVGDLLLSSAGSGHSGFFQFPPPDTRGESFAASAVTLADT